MLKRFLSTTVALALAMSASAALAGTYVTGPLPAEFLGGFVPSLQGGIGPKVLGNEQKASALGAKLAASVEKCYSKGAKNFSGNKATGVSACLNDTAKGVLPKYVIAVNKINLKAPGLPPCNNFVGNGAVVAALVPTFDGSTYCQSPSGAFVDGAASF